MRAGICAGNMQLRKLRQLCERLFKLPGTPQTLSVRCPAGTVAPCNASEDAVLDDLDLQVQFNAQKWLRDDSADFPRSPCSITHVSAFDVPDSSSVGHGTLRATTEVTCEANGSGED